MFRYAIGFAVIAISLVGTSRITSGQEERARSRRPPTLSDRLEQFRDDLFGDGQQAKQRSSGKTQSNKAQSGKPQTDANQSAGGSQGGAVTENPFAADSKVRAGSNFSSRSKTDEPQKSAANNAPRNAKTQPTPAQSNVAGRAAQTPLVARSNRRTIEADASASSKPEIPLAKPLPADVTRMDSPADDVQLDMPPTLEEKLAAMRRAASKQPTSALKKPIAAVKKPAYVARAERPEPTDAAPTATSEATPESDAAISNEPAESEPVEREPVEEVPVVVAPPKRASARPAIDNVLFSSQNALLTVEASGPRKVLIGKEAAFTVRVRNAGDVAANNVVVTINIPSFAEVASAQPTAGTTRSPAGAQHTEPFEWKISRLEARARETLTLKIVPHKSLPLDLSAQWSCAPEISQTLVEVQEPKLLLALSGPEEVLYGQSKIFKLTMSNPGNGDAENVVVSLLPIGRSGEGSASHRLGTLRAGESKAIEVELTARQAGALTIKAQAFADGGLRAEVAEQVLVRRANLKVDVVGAKVKYAGTTCTYQIKVSNSGNAPADKVQVSAMLPPEAKFVSATGGGRHEADQAKIVWAAVTLQPGAEREFDILCSLHAAGENRLQVLAMGERELSGSGMVATRVEALADLKLEVRDPQGPIPVGEDSVFEVIVRNRGTKAAEGIDLVVFFSEGLEATAVQGGAHEIGNGQVAFKPITTLGAGSEAVFRIHAKADRGGNHVFRAEVVCSSLHTKLAAEETTHFYGDETVAAKPKTARRKRVAPVEPQAELQPTPAEEPNDEQQ